jgi:hypothetical protein
MTHDHLAICVMVAGAGLVAGGVLFGRRRTRRAASATPAPASDVPAAPLLATPTSERRHDSRRLGTWLTVCVLNTRSGGAPFEGHVIDCGPNGLGLTLLREVRVGHTLSIRAATSPASMPWMRAEVMSCEPLDRGVWRVGCHVDHADPWHALSKRS